MLKLQVSGKLREVGRGCCIFILGSRNSLCNAHNCKANDVAVSHLQMRRK